MIFDGRAYANLLLEELKVKREKLEVVPRLVWLCVGEDEASVVYGKLKARAAEKLGIEFEKVYLGEEIEDIDLRNEIKKHCENKNVHGVMVQLPARVKGNLYGALGEIWMSKDIDCLNPYSIGMLLAGEGLYLPATVGAVGQILMYALGEIESPINDLGSLLKIGKVLEGKRVVVIGGGWEVGKPLVGLLSNWGASVFWVRSKEVNLGEVVNLGDIVISATGKKNLVEGTMIQEGAVVIDVGAPWGDVDFGSVRTVARFLTPVPGGVGPVTVACLMANVINAVEENG